jgi:hypothetical protein
LSAHAFASVVLLLSVAVAVQARQGTMPTGPRRDPEAERIRDEQQREMQLRNTGEAKAAPATDERAVKAAVQQLNQDFKRVQVIRNDVARSLVTGGALDYERISEQAVELKKRALRMQTLLALRTGVEGKGQVEVKGQTSEAGLDDERMFDEGRMKDALVRLCKRIDSFVANPRFKSPGVVDVEGTAKAGRDLREIISLSNAVHESAGRLGQGSAAVKHSGP